MKKIVSLSFFACFALLLTACATTADNKTPASAAQNAGSENAGSPHGAAHASAPVQSLNLPNADLTPEIFYQLVLGEVAAQRGNDDVAVSVYLNLAHTTRDPRIAQRATEIAWNARMPGAAQDAAQLWVETSGGAPQAEQILVTLLLNQGKLDEAKPHIQKLLASDKTNVGPAFLTLGALFAQHRDRAQALQVLRDLAQPYGKTPEAHFAVARAAWGAKDDKLALDEDRAALKLKPDWEEAALLQAQILHEETSNDAARDYLKKFVAKNPSAPEARLQYARLLANMQDFAGAREQFQTLLQQSPNDPDIALAAALLSVQLKDNDAARAQFQQALDAGYRDPGAIHFYLGMLEEDNGNNDAALQQYAQVSDGEQVMAACARTAGVLAKQGKLKEARAYLKGVYDKTQDKLQRRQLVQIDAQLLNDAGQYQAAYDELGGALKSAPDSTDLLYDQAMIAEKIDKLDAMESNLRKVIQLKPDYAHAYNALGYTFADRNMRLPEAQTLIAQALKLAPDDPFIIDSMGWVLYRLGQNKESLTYLQRAFDMSHDAEIAAHLGEVLWASGQHDQAKQVWNSALKDHPDNDALNATVKKFLN